MSKRKLLVGGFYELLPHEQLIFNKIKNIIENNFRKHGFVSIETPAVERNLVLTAKGGGEVSKQIFGLYGLAQGCEKDTKNYSLHFDLTVPLARYIIDYEDKLVFPFKRYQIQKVWRGERHQRGRFKEFYQCDVDVIDKKDIDVQTEAETILVLMKTLVDILTYLGSSDKLELHVNNKKLIDYVINTYGLHEKREDFLNLLDKFYKLPFDEFRNKLLKVLNNSEEKVNNLLNFFENIKKGVEAIDNIDSIIHLSNLQKILKELLKINNLENKVIIKIDPFIVRGLDYYTGTVFETFVEGRYGFGSICSGGRYDKLVEYIAQVYNLEVSGYKGFGGSIGLTRLFDRLREMGLLDKIKERESLADVLIFNVPGGSLKYKAQIAALLRDNGISTELYPRQEKLAKQFKYANAKKIPVGVFVGEDEEKEGNVKIKDLKERDSYEVKVEEVVDKVKELLIRNFKG